MIRFFLAIAIAIMPAVAMAGDSAGSAGSIAPQVVAQATATIECLPAAPQVMSIPQTVITGWAPITEERQVQITLPQVATYVSNYSTGYSGGWNYGGNYGGAGYSGYGGAGAGDRIQELDYKLTWRQKRAIIRWMRNHRSPQDVDHHIGDNVIR